jgi:hypothetical protein
MSEADCYDKMMDRYFRCFRILHGIRAETKEEFYGFAASDVHTFYSHKQGLGAGLYYRLRDGRVIDAGGQPHDPDPLLYDAATH